MSVLIAILGFGLLVFIHELGHFLFARLTGMTVDVFSIGFGPSLYQVKRGETIYQLALLPFGGYVKIRGLTPEPEEDPEALAEAERQAQIARGERTLSDVEREWGLEGPFEASDELKEKLGQARSAPTPPTLAQEPSQEAQAPEEGSFQSKSLWARFLVIGGGPLFNLIFTILVFWVLLASQSALSVLKYRSPSLAFKELSGAAAEAGLKPGDVLLSVNGDPISSFDELKARTSHSKGAALSLLIARPPEGAAPHYEPNDFQKDCLKAISEEAPKTTPEKAAAACEAFEGVTRYSRGAPASWERLSVSVTPREVKEGVYLLGVTPELDRFGVEGLMSGLSLATEESLGLMRTMYEKLLGAARGREQVEVASVVKITAMSADTVGMGGDWFFHFLAFLSLNLALLNLLPLPALDGGRLIFLMIEAVSRRPVPPKMEAMVHGIGVLFLITLTLWVTARDILSLL